MSAKKSRRADDDDESTDDMSSFISYDDVDKESSSHSSDEWIDAADDDDTSLNSLFGQNGPTSNNRQWITVGDNIRLKERLGRLPNKAILFEFASLGALRAKCQQSYAEVAGHLVLVTDRIYDFGVKCLYIVDHPAFGFEESRASFEKAYYITKALAVGGYDHTQNCLVTFDFIDASAPNDVPLYFEDAIAVLRTRLRELCNNATHDAPFVCYHENMVHYTLSPRDKCFARLFPGDELPLPQWFGVGMTIDRNSATRINQISFFSDKSWHSVFNDPVRRTTLREICYMYRLHCDTTCDFVIVADRKSLHKNYCDAVATIADLLKPRPEWKCNFACTKNDRVSPVALYFFSGPSMTFDRETFLKDSMEVFAPWKPKLFLPENREPAFTNFRSLGAYKSTFKPLLNESLKCKRGLRKIGQIGWYERRQTLMETVLALMPLELPPYVVLWTLDWLSDYVHCEHIRKIHLIEKLIASRRSVMTRRFQGEYVRDFKRQMWTKKKE